MNAPITNKDGSYYKTLCVLNGRLGNHSSYYGHCESYGLKFFRIESSFIQTEASNALNKWFPAESALFIDGVRDTSDGNWYYLSYSKALVPNELTWTLGAACSTGCLSFRRIKNYWQAEGTDCGGVSNAVCEYKNGTTTTAIACKLIDNY